MAVRELESAFVKGLAVATLGAACIAGVVYAKSYTPEGILESRIARAKIGNLDRPYGASLKFSEEGVVKSVGNFDGTLEEVTRLCGVPVSISYSHSDGSGIGYLIVKDPNCLRPLTTELARLAEH